MSIRLLTKTLALLLGYATSMGQVLEYNTEVEWNKDILVVDEHVLIQINNRNMDWLAEVGLPYQAGDEIDIVSAAILTTDGTVLRKLTKKEINTRHNISNISLFEDDLVKEFTLQWNQYPYRIAVHTRVATKRFIFLCAWTPLYRGLAATRAQLRVRYPAEKSVSLFSRFAEEGDSIVAKGDVIRTWNFAKANEWKSEALAPAANESMPVVFVMPKEIHYGVDGSLNSWAEYGDWQDRLNAGLLELPAEEKYKVHQLIRDIPDTVSRIRKLYHYVQDNTRYINVSLDIGGLKSYPASYVSANKYGDCKALTTFMKSLLGEIGIRSYYANVNLDKNPRRVTREAPGPQFNHMILCVPLGKDTVWLENTSNATPYNYLGTSMGDEALIVNGVHSALVRTPRLSGTGVLSRKSFDVTVELDGSAKGTSNWELRGEEFDVFSYSLRNEVSSDFRSRLERLLTPTHAQLKTYSIKPHDRDDPTLRLDLQLEYPEVLRKAGQAMVLKPLMLDLPIDIKDLEPVAKRTLPVRLRNPVWQEEIHIYRIPFLAAYRITLPKDVEKNSAYGRLTLRHILEGTTVRVERRIELAPADIPLREYPAFYGFLQEIEDIGRTSALLIEPK